MKHPSAVSTKPAAGQAAAIYAQKVEMLAGALNRPEQRPEAAQALRMLRTVLVPGPSRGDVFATLHGELATIMEWTVRQGLGGGKNTDTPGAVLAGVSVSLVVGARSYRYRHSLEVTI